MKPLLALITFAGFLLGACSLNNTMDPRDTANDCGTYPNQSTSPYVLPYPVDTSYRVTQGNCGSFSHLTSNSFTYAYDFDMAIGTTITAARAGTVVFTEESYTDGNGGFGQENLVVIQHDDNTFARYIHLTKNGALVEVGDVVAPGDPVGLSGNTGLSIAPHLHFDVTSACNMSDCPTIPVTFRNTKAHPNGLVPGQSYRAEAADNQ